MLSVELGLELVNNGQTLRLYNPQIGEYLPTPAEASARARQEAARASQEAAARQAAEDRAAKLAAKLRALGIDPEQE